MNLLHTIHHPSRLHDARFTPRVNGSGEILLVGAEDKVVSIYDIPSSTDSAEPPKIIAKLIGHSNRIKALETLRISLPTSATTITCTASSDGKIHVYDLGLLPEKNESEVTTIEPVAEYDTKGTRLTCVTLADGDVNVAVADEATGNGKRKHEDEDSNEEEEEEEEEGWNGVGEGQDEDEESEEEEGEEAIEGEEEEEEEA
jgi:protein MAK11